MKEKIRNNAFYELDTERICKLVAEIDPTVDKKSIEKIIEECFIDEKDKTYDVSNHPDVIKARKIIQQKRFDDDLDMIKKAYPDEQARSVWEFGDPFISLVMTGIVDALTAYEAYRAYKKRQAEAFPPEIGGVQSRGYAKEFYSPQEVDRMSMKDFEDPKVMKKVRNSMLRWK